MSLGRGITKEVKAQLWPLLDEMGFNDGSARSATRIDGPFVTMVQVDSPFPKWETPAGKTAISFGAEVGVSIGASVPASFATHDPYVPDIAEAALRASLSRTGDRFASTQFGDGRVDQWQVDDQSEIADAVADMVTAFQNQALPLLEDWTDLARCYAIVADETTVDRPGSIGSPEISYPGMPGSISREMRLAVLAATQGDNQAELRHLHNLLELHERLGVGFPAVSDRIAAIST